MELSPKVKQKHADRWMRVLEPVLSPGETIWAFTTASRLKPMSLATAITSARVLGFVAHAKPEKTIVYEVSFDEIQSFDLGSKKGLPHLVITTPADTIDFGSFQPQEVEFTEHYLRHILDQRSGPTGPADPRPTPHEPAIAPVSRASDAFDVPATTTQLPLSAPTPAAPTPASASSGAASAGLADELERLASLYERGILDADEFRAAKRTAIGNLGREFRSVSL